MSPRADERAVPSRFVQPLVCRKRRRIGVDGRVLTGERFAEPLTLRPAFSMHADLPELGPPRAALAMESVLEAIGLTPEARALLPPGRAPRVAVVDADFGGWSALGEAVDRATLELSPLGDPLQFPRAVERPAPMQRAVGHGVAMAGVVRAVAPGARLGLFEAPLTQSSYVYPTDLAAAIARAAGAWNADVVLVALAHGYWGMPAHLRAVLRGATRHGRGGRGAAVVCCSGRLDQNRDVHGDSAALAGDDFTSQPEVIPVSACTLDGRWYRVHQYPLSRLGPAIELCAPGELVRVPGAGTADDSSLAAALVAGAAALALEANPRLSLAELRHVLRATAEAGEVDDAPPGTGLEAGRLNERDRTGHNFKTGYGKVHILRACLAAADPVALALLSARHAPGRDPAAEAMAAAWERHLQALAGRLPEARRYLEIRGRLVPAVIGDLALCDALLWLGRHVLALRREGASAWQGDGMDHGVLADRLRQVLELLRCPAAGRRSPAVRRWAGRLLDALSVTPAEDVAGFVAAALDFPSGPEA